MIGVGLAALLALMAQDAGEWQDFGKESDGSAVMLNPDTVITGGEGPEAMVRVRYARAAANKAVTADYRTTFNCSARTAARLRMGERDATGEIVSRDDEGVPMPAVNAPAGTPMGKLLDAVCEIAAAG
jgi:hypothetical protein